MASFSNQIYETDSGIFVQIRVSAQTVAVPGNTAATGPINDNRIRAYASNPGSKRKKQLNARGLNLQRFTGTGATRKRFTTFVPFFTEAALAAISPLQEVTLNSVVWTAYDKTGEA